MKLRKLMFLLFVILFTGCEYPSDNESYTDKTVNIYNDLEPPVILFSKNKSFGVYGVSLIDGKGNVYTLGNMSTFANQIGNSYNVGDTLKRK